MKREGVKIEEPVQKMRYRTVIYKECFKNHAAAIGRHAVDGCLEFLASGAEGTPGAFTCHACGCHMYFHKRVTIEYEGEVYAPPAPPSAPQTNQQLA